MALRGAVDMVARRPVAATRPEAGALEARRRAGFMAALRPVASGRRVVRLQEATAVPRLEPTGLPGWEGHPRASDRRGADP
jgi:hypothetical protein